MDALEVLDASRVKHLMDAIKVLLDTLHLTMDVMDMNKWVLWVLGQEGFLLFCFCSTLSSSKKAL
jgi:hypothetical protein